MLRTGQLMGVNMKIIKLLCMSCFFLSANLFANSSLPLPQDVQIFIDNADNCEHFAGEWDDSLSKIRQHKIEQSIDKYCGLAKKQQGELLEKYKGDKAIQNQVSGYEF